MASRLFLLPAVPCALADQTIWSMGSPHSAIPETGCPEPLSGLHPAPGPPSVSVLTDLRQASLSYLWSPGPPLAGLGQGAWLFREAKAQ